VELPNGDLLVCWFHGSGERTADDVKIEGARWSKKTGTWSERFTMADTPGFPDTNPTMFIDSRQRLLSFWPVIIAHQWETALMKYRISTDYSQASGPPKWEHQDNIILIPKDIAAKTREVFEKDKDKEGRAGAYAARVIEHADNMYFSRMGWFTRTIRFNCLPGASWFRCIQTAFPLALWRLATTEDITGRPASRSSVMDVFNPLSFARKTGLSLRTFAIMVRLRSVRT
jgi:hypothetical protein